MPKSAFDLTGRVALVTGGSKGLGKAMARGFAEAGADVVISSRHEDELKAALAEIRQNTSVRGMSVVADLTKRSEADRLAKAALAEMGHVDILVNNAGSNVPEEIDQISDANWDRILELNLSSCMALTRAVVPQMKSRKWGRVIYISSIMGLASKAGRDAYSATKSAVIGLRASQRARAGQVRDHGQLFGSRTLPHRSARQAAERCRKGDLRPAHGSRPLGRSARAGRTGPAVGQRRRQLHHRADAGGRRRHALHDVLIEACARCQHLCSTSQVAWRS